MEHGGVGLSLVHLQTSAMMGEGVCPVAEFGVACELGLACKGACEVAGVHGVAGVLWVWQGWKMKNKGLDHNNKDKDDGNKDNEDELM